MIDKTFQLFIHRQKEKKQMRIILRLIGLVFAFAILLSVPQHSTAQSCLPFLKKKDLTHVAHFMTLNKNGVGSWSQFKVSYRESVRHVPGYVRPAQWYTNLDNAAKPDETRQLFSDRYSGFIRENQQPFDMVRPDLINVIISVEISPQITVTLRSWGNKKATFRATCSASGIMHGSTPDVDYLLFLKPVEPIV